MGKGKASTNEKGDPKQAQKYYERGCDLNDPDSCLHAGLIMVSKSMSSPIERDVLKGCESLTKSCKLDNGTACFYLSGMYISGVQKKENTNNAPESNEFILMKDMKKAFQFAQRACDLDNMYACANLSQMYKRGEGTEKDEQKAEQIKRKALDMQDQIKRQTELKFQQGL